MAWQKNSERVLVKMISVLWTWSSSRTKREKKRTLKSVFDLEYAKIWTYDCQSLHIFDTYSVFRNLTFSLHAKLVFYFTSLKSTHKKDSDGRCNSNEKLNYWSGNQNHLNMIRPRQPPILKYLFTPSILTMNITNVIFKPFCSIHVKTFASVYMSEKSCGGSIPHWGHLSSQCDGPLGLYVSLFMWQCLSVCLSTIVHSDRRGGQGFTERGRGRRRWPVLIQTIMPRRGGSDFGY